LALKENDSLEEKGTLLVEEKRVLTDREIINSVLNGRKENFAMLVERYQTMVSGQAWQLCHNWDTAMDLAQETFIAAYNALDRLQNPDAFGGWLLGILKNKHRNLLRAQKLQTVPLNESHDELPQPEEGNNFLTPEEMSKISRYLQALPEKYREVLVLKYIEEHSYRDISSLLKLPVSTITMRLNYARKFLLRKIKEDGWL
jgi:RNA polymerase sigma-70 factor (ECF subfamily)